MQRFKSHYCLAVWLWSNVGDLSCMVMMTSLTISLTFQLLLLLHQLSKLSIASLNLTQLFTTSSTTTSLNTIQHTSFEMKRAFFLQEDTAPTHDRTKAAYDQHSELETVRRFQTKRMPSCLHNFAPVTVTYYGHTNTTSTLWSFRHDQSVKASIPWNTGSPNVSAVLLLSY